MKYLLIFLLFTGTLQAQSEMFLVNAPVQLAGTQFPITTVPMLVVASDRTPEMGPILEYVNNALPGQVVDDGTFYPVLYVYTGNQTFTPLCNATLAPTRDLSPGQEEAVSVLIHSNSTCGDLPSFELAEIN